MTTPPHLAHASAPRVRQNRAAWLLPLVALAWAGETGYTDPSTGSALLLVAGVCTAAGVVWQWLHRRDLVDRLTHFACAFTVVATTVFALSWNDLVTSSMHTGVGLSGVVTGLVFAEHWLRGRDARWARRLTATATAPERSRSR